MTPASTSAPDAAPAPDLDRFTTWAFICEASDCRWRGAAQLRESLASTLQQRACTEVAVVRTGCLSLCGAGPALVTYPAGDVHLHVQHADAPALAEQLASGQPLATRTVRAPAWYRQSIVARLGYYVQLLKRRAAATAAGSTGSRAS